MCVPVRPPATRGGAGGHVACTWASMNVQVALFAHLATYQPDGQGGRHARAFDLPEGTTVADVVRKLGLPDQPRVIFVNGRHAEEDRTLVDSDRLAIFPPIAGG